MKPYVFLDRDGTVIVERNYLASVDGLELLPGALEGLRELQQAGYGLVIITNQSGIGRGFLTPGTLAAIHTELNRQLAEGGITLDAIYFCPHTPADQCDCRKPKPKLVLEAARDLDIDLARSFMIGDKPADIDLANNAGLRAILVRTGYGREYESSVAADFVADDLAEAARYVLRTH